MMTLVDIITRMQDIPNLQEEDYIKRGRLDILYWLKNNNYLRTEKEVNDKICRYKEELLAFFNHDVYYREKQARIEELNNYLFSELF